MAEFSDVLRGTVVQAEVYLVRFCTLLAILQLSDLAPAIFRELGRAISSCTQNQAT